MNSPGSSAMSLRVIVVIYVSSARFSPAVNFDKWKTSQAMMSSSRLISFNWQPLVDQIEFPFSSVPDSYTQSGVKLSVIPLTSISMMMGSVLTYGEMVLASE